MKAFASIVGLSVGVTLCTLLFPCGAEGQQNLEYGACATSTGCSGGCFPGIEADQACINSGKRCVLYQCSTGATQFKTCIQATNKDPGCNVDYSTPLNVQCSGCTKWLGSCRNLDPNCADLPWCGSAGGSTGWSLTVYYSCT
jgi:hypothetical protein